MTAEVCGTLHADQPLSLVSRLSNALAKAKVEDWQRKGAKALPLTAHSFGVERHCVLDQLFHVVALRTNYKLSNVIGLQVDEENISIVVPKPGSACAVGHAGVLFGVPVTLTLPRTDLKLVFGYVYIERSPLQNWSLRNSGTEQVTLISAPELLQALGISSGQDIFVFGGDPAQALARMLSQKKGEEVDAISHSCLSRAADADNETSSCQLPQSSQKTVRTSRRKRAQRADKSAAALSHNSADESRRHEAAENRGEEALCASAARSLFPIGVLTNAAFRSACRGSILHRPQRCAWNSCHMQGYSFWPCSHFSVYSRIKASAPQSEIRPDALHMRVRPDNGMWADTGEDDAELIGVDLAAVCSVELATGEDSKGNLEGHVQPSCLELATTSCANLEAGSYLNVNEMLEDDAQVTCLDLDTASCADIQKGTGPNTDKQCGDLDTQVSLSSPAAELLDEVIEESNWLVEELPEQSAWQLVQQRRQRRGGGQFVAQQQPSESSRIELQQQPPESPRIEAEEIEDVVQFNSFTNQLQTSVSRDEPFHADSSVASAARGKVAGHCKMPEIEELLRGWLLYLWATEACSIWEGERDSDGAGIMYWRSRRNANACWRLWHLERVLLRPSPYRSSVSTEVCALCAWGRDGRICSCLPNPMQPVLFEPDGKDPFADLPAEMASYSPPPGLCDQLEEPGKIWRRLLRGTHAYSLQGAPSDVSLHSSDPARAIAARQRLRNAAWRRWWAAKLRPQREVWPPAPAELDMFPPTPTFTQLASPAPRELAFHVPVPMPMVPYVFMPVPAHLVSPVQTYVEQLQVRM